jgi:hypothetical protein
VRPLMRFVYVRHEEGLEVKIEAGRYQVMQPVQLFPDPALKPGTEYCSLTPTLATQGDTSQAEPLVLLVDSQFAHANEDGQMAVQVMVAPDKANKSGQAGFVAIARFDGTKNLKWTGPLTAKNAAAKDVDGKQEAKNQVGLHYRALKRLPAYRSAASMHLKSQGKVPEDQMFTVREVCSWDTTRVRCYAGWVQVQSKAAKKAKAETFVEQIQPSIHTGLATEFIIDADTDDKPLGITFVEVINPEWAPGSSVAKCFTALLDVVEGSSAALSYPEMAKVRTQTQACSVSANERGTPFASGLQ